MTSSTQTQHGILPTPPLPEDLPAAVLTDNARQVLIRRYVERSQARKAARHMKLESQQ